MNIKAEVLVLAGLLADGEAIPRLEAEMSLERLVARICADRNVTVPILCLIATTLAKHIDAQDMVLSQPMGVL